MTIERKIDISSSVKKCAWSYVNTSFNTNLKSNSSMVEKQVRKWAKVLLDMLSKVCLKKVGLTGFRLKIEMNILNGHSSERTAPQLDKVGKRLQLLLGYSSLGTTLIYMQISETNIAPDFSPLDIWEDDDDQKA